MEKTCLLNCLSLLLQFSSAIQVHAALSQYIQRYPSTYRAILVHTALS